jgi:ParB family chromosome partitioning protein
MTKKNALGRGLGALIEEASTQEPESTPLRNESAVKEIELEKVDINPFQPRKNFDQEALKELSESIRQLGIIQPITVRVMEDGRYQLISGERRMRASLLAGLTTVPAYVREADDQAMLELALVENIQREDLDAIEISISYQRLIEECNLTQDALSERVGKKRATVANYLRLLKLPAEIQMGIRDRKISMGHARALLSVEDADLQLDLFNRAITEELSVRKVEELARYLTDKMAEIEEAVEDDNEAESVDKQNDSKPDKEISKSLRDILNTKVSVKRSSDGKGKIVIPFTSDEDLAKILSIFDLLK